MVQNITIGVIISTYNNPAWLEKTLWGYLCQDRMADEIIKFTGVSCSLLMLFLILSRLMSISKYQLYRHHYFDLAEKEVGKNCIYRFVNNPRFNWRSLLYAVVKSFFKNLNKSLEKSGTTNEGKKVPTFFVVDYLETMESVAESPEQENRICAVIRSIERQDAA